MSSPRFVVVVARDDDDDASPRKRRALDVDARRGRVLTLDDVDAPPRTLRVDARLGRCRVSARIARSARGSDAVSVVERACGARNVARYAPADDGEAWACDVEPGEGESWSQCADAVARAARAIATSADEGRAIRDYDAECDNGF